MAKASERSDRQRGAAMPSATRGEPAVTEGERAMNEASNRYVAAKRREDVTVPPPPRRKNKGDRRAMAARREQGYQQFGSQRLGTLADVWPGARP